MATVMVMAITAATVTEPQRGDATGWAEPATDTQTTGPVGLRIRRLVVVVESATGIEGIEGMGGEVGGVGVGVG